MRRPNYRSALSAFLAFLLACAPGSAQVLGTRTSDPLGKHRNSPHVRPANFENSTRIHDLIRSGNLYLSLSDALALAIENNLDIELQRFSLPLSDTDLLRARGGGTLRGVPFILAEAPAGVGGPLSPLVTNPASASSVTPGTSVATNPLELGVLGEVQTNLSVQGTIPQSNGTPITIFDPAVVGQLNWTHQTTPQTNSVVTGTNSLISKTFTGNIGIAEGFSTGTQLNLAFDNNHQSLNSLRSSYNPFTASSLGLTVTQPLLRGFGPSLNRRFIHIANNNQKITSLLFEQQLLATVYGVTRLYTDLVALYEDVKVKEDSLTLTQKLFSDTQVQVQEGTLARVEMTRANASVFSSRQDLINSRGLLEEQEAILKNVLSKTGNADPQLHAARIIPTDSLNVPEKEEVRPMQDLLSDAMANRPDIRQAGIQIDNSEIGLKGARNALLPQVDLVGVAQNSGLAGTLNPLAPTSDVSLVGGYGSALDQVFTRKFPTYGVGVQVTLPIRNRIAEADLARDEIQLRQSQIRARQLENQARLEVEDALIAMRRARSSYEAAVQARVLQQESLEAEQSKFEVGASTSFFVIQYQSLLTQAKSTEVAAKSAYVKARAALARATGTILIDHQISVESAYQNHK
jgi:outer membrane protein